MNRRKIILASASPRRKEILEQVGITFEVIPSKKEEVISGQLPAEVVEELSYQKAMDVMEQICSDRYEEEQVIIGADTVVSYEKRILGKPKGEADALQMLSLLQGNTHQVYTGVTLILQKGQKKSTVTFHECTDVTLYPMSREQIEAYVVTGEPMDKAGAYAIQGKFALYIKEIHGDYNTVVGFPIARIMRELEMAEQKMEQEG